MEEKTLNLSVIYLKDCDYKTVHSKYQKKGLCIIYAGYPCLANLWLDPLLLSFSDANFGNFELHT